MTGANSDDLYNEVAADFDASFEGPTHRRAYDILAGEYIAQFLPAPAGLIVEAGCGTGRWASRWLALGHRVIGIESASEMIRKLEERALGPRFTLVAEGMESARIAPGSADLVVAMGSVQYAKDPASMIGRFASWVKPGGIVCVYTDSLVALALELLRLGKTEECLVRLRTQRGVFSAGGEQAELRLYHSASLVADFVAAGLVDIDCRGLLITSSAWGREGCAKPMTSDEAGLLKLEHQLSSFAVLADVGRHIIASGRRPI